MARKKWRDLTSGQQAAVLILAFVQASLAFTAWVDLARRPAAAVNGRKAKWGAIIAVSFVGPIVYFRRGRLPTR